MMYPARAVKRVKSSRAGFRKAKINKNTFRRLSEMSKEKVVLAYSGGLDTNSDHPVAEETFGYDVICCCIDCGQGEELDGLDERAKLSGASQIIY